MRGRVTLHDVNIGIALPREFSRFDVGCNWGQKAVDALAARSMFDGFVGGGQAAEDVARIVAEKPHDCGICQGVPGRAEIWLCVCNPFRGPEDVVPYPVPLPCHLGSFVERRKRAH